MSERRVGVACDGVNVAIAWRDASARGARWKTIVVPSDATPESIARAVKEVAAKAPATPDSVVLTRPLAHTRAVRMPSMPRAQLESVLARDWSRHVIGHRNTTHSVSARVADRGRWIAAFAPADLLDTLPPAATIATGDDALASTARALAREQASSVDSFVVLCDASGPTDILHLRAGQPWMGRQLLRDATAADVIAFIESATAESGVQAPLVVLGADTKAASLAAELQTHGVRALTIDPGLAPEATSLEILAACGTIGEASLPLRSTHARQEQAARMRGATRWLTLVAAATLLAGVGIARWRASSELADVRRERAEIAAPVRTALGTRTDVERSLEAATALAEHEAHATRVGGVLASVALALPPGATLTTLRIAGDSVAIEGESSRSAAVYDALRRVSSLEQVKLASPLRQERLAGNVVERFAFSARVRHDTTRTGAR